MESQPQNPKLGNNPGNFHPCKSSLSQNPLVYGNVLKFRTLLVQTLFYLYNI